MYIAFSSDGSITREGLYLDDVRVLGTLDVDAQPLGSDPYGGRQYELKNAGQVAGLGTDANDLQVPEAWDLVTPSPEVVVAVIDSGVDLGHPDLNLVTGYDSPSGSIGGAPQTNDDNHGTACAGNVGAIRNNARGVSGTAPGVKIMPVYALYDGATDASLAVGIDLAVQHGARVLSNSWGWVGAPAAVVEDAVRDALANNRVVVFASGNGTDRPPYSYDVSFPAMLTATTDVLAVGASSPTDEYKGAASSDGLFSWGSSYAPARGPTWSRRRRGATRRIARASSDTIRAPPPRASTPTTRTISGERHPRRRRWRASSR